MSPGNPSDGRKPTLAGLVLDRALVSREHLAMCLAYQKALQADPQYVHTTLGEILVEKGLLREEDVQAMEEELADWGKPKAMKEVAVAPPAKAAGTPSREAGKRHKRTPAAEPGSDEKPGTSRKSHTLLIALFGGVIVALFLAMKFWPQTGGKSVLGAYLTSCREGGQPNQKLATVDFGIVVRQFEVQSIGEGVRYDYGGELRAYGGSRGVVDWTEFLAVSGMEGPKHRVLSALIPGLPGNLTPQNVGSLAVTAQKIRCRLVYKLKDKRLFRKADIEFTLLLPQSSRWNPGWLVAAADGIE